ncbi:MAG: hypothetical protein C0631_02715 [Sedimenticola sp.]|nr:MAG: hypothetical protein C0631_02715 [Sedimenticola sp.]
MFIMAERRGFEPRVACATIDFESNLYKKPQQWGKKYSNKNNDLLRFMSFILWYIVVIFRD